MRYDLLFSLNITLFALHEMDAVRCCEWRMLFGLNKLKDQTAYMVFAAFHLPIFYMLIGSLYSGVSVVQCLIDLLFVIHAVVHLGFRRHRENRFNWFSNVIIYGLGISAIVRLWYLTSLFL